MAGRGTLTIRVVGDTKPLTKSLDSSMSKLGGFATKALKVGAVAGAAIGVGVVKSFADFDAAMNESLAIMGNVSDAMRKDLSDAARKVALTTKFSAKEAAEALFFLASSGLDAKQSIGALPQVAKFAQAGMFDLATATEFALDAQSALGLKVKDAGKNLKNLTRVTDVLTKANILSNATLEQFAAAITNKAGPALRAVGKDIEEGVAVLAAFAAQGVKGEEAGEALNIVMRDLQRAALKNKDSFKELGVAVFDSRGEMRHIGDIIGDLEGLLDGMSDAQRRATLTTLGFQDKSVSALITLLGTSEAIKEYDRELRKAGGTTQAVADKQLQTFREQLRLLKDMFIDVAITVGGLVVPALGALVKFVQGQMPRVKAVIEGAFKGISDWWSNNEGVIRGAAFTIVNSFRIVRDIIGDLGGIARDGMRAFESDTKGPMQSVATFINTKLFPAFASLRDWWDENEGVIRGKAFTMFTEMKKAAEKAKEEFGKFLEPLKEIGRFIRKGDVKEAAGKFGDLFAALFEFSLENASKVAAKIIDAIGEVDWFKLGKEMMTNVVPRLALGILAGILSFDWAVTLVDALADNWFEVLTSAILLAFVPGKVIGVVTKALARIPFAGKLMAWGLQALHGLGRVIIRALGQVLGRFGGVFIRTLTGKTGPQVVGGLKGLGMLVVKTISGWWETIKIAAIILLDNFAKLLANLIRGAWSKAIRPAFGFLKEKIVSWFGPAVSWLFRAGRNILSGLLNGIRDRAVAVAQWFREMGGRIARHVGDLGKTLFNAGKNLIKGFIGGAVEAAKGIAKGIGGAIGGGIGKAIDFIRNPFGGPKPGEGALAGGGIQRLIGFMQSTGIPHRVTSTIRPGDPGFHGLGRAVDFAGQTPGSNTPNLRAIQRAWHAVGSNLKELIGPIEGMNIKNGRPFKYSAGTQRAHMNHVHVAMANGGLIREPIFGLGLRTNRTYSFGERGPERVTAGAGGGEVILVVNIDGKEVARAAVDPLRRELNQIKRRNVTIGLA